MPTSLLGSLRGAALPRVRVAPAAAYSLGAEAAELSRRAGLPLDEWQADGLGIILSVRPDGKWACFEYCEICARQNGKTVGLFAPRALAGLLLFDERLIMWSAHEYKTAMESFRQFKSMLLALGKEISPNLIDLGDGVRIKVNNTNGEESFERLDSDQRVKFIARSKGSGRGFGATNLIDETFAYTRAQQDALMPTILAQPNPQFCYASSPPLDGESGDVLFSLRERAEAGGDDGLGYRDWGIEGDLDHLEKVDLDDRANWAASNPATASGRLTEEKILRSRRSMSDLGFAREVLGLWPVQIGADGGVIDPRVWAALADPESQILGPMVFGLDAGPGQSSGAIGVAGRRADGIPHVEITGRDGVIDHRTGVEWMVPRVVELNQRWHPAWVLDPSGPAGALLGGLRKAGIEPLLVTGQELAGVCGAFLTAATAPDRDKLRHRDQPVLNAAIKAARKRPVGDGAWTWGRKASDSDITPLYAGTLALHGLAVGPVTILDGALMA